MILEINKVNKSFLQFYRGESILLFLVQTIGRQLIEQRQYRSALRQRSTSASRKGPSTEGNLSSLEYSKRNYKEIKTKVNYT